MINIKIRCPHCFLKIACGDDFKGSDVSCPGCKQTIRIPTPHFDLGTNVRGFTIEQWLGNGAMGEVYLARQLSMDRLIALKIMPQHKLNNEEDKQRFVREVQTLANLKHPNIVSAIEAGEYEGGAYLAMDYINGISVEDKIIMEGSIQESLALRICETIADALEHAWDNCTLIHRDLKPANFMIDKESNIHLMDMGIAKRADYDTDITAIGIVMGTPYYMSPEQAKGIKELDLRSDIYSLGASLYHMITGKAPYSKNSTSASVMSLKLSEPPEDPRKFNSKISKATIKLMKQLMAKEPEKRPQTWEEVKELIQTTRKNRKSSTGSNKKGNSGVAKKSSGASTARRSSGPVKKSPSGKGMIIFMFMAIIAMTVILVYLAVK